MERGCRVGIKVLALAVVGLAACGDDAAATDGDSRGSSGGGTTGEQTSSSTPTGTSDDSTGGSEAGESASATMAHTTTTDPTTGEPTTGPAPFCGDGEVDFGEACDDGNADDSDACTQACQLASCGDGIVGPGEGCDDGDDDDGDECTNACALAQCGDGVVQVGVETCDDGNNDDSDTCTQACAPAQCGDGLLGPGEACDDGNQSDQDDCTNACASPSCGDGVVKQGAETCDDGNDDNSDACLNTCILAECGDGVVEVGVEECDDANDDDLDACSDACLAASCDDGIQNGDETDLDCGGDCPKCELGAACAVDDDCDEVTCLEGACIDVRSCKTIHASDGELPDGVYPIDPDGQEPGAGFDAYCDMSTDGGGWTLVARINGADAQNLLYDVWTAGETVGDVGNFSLVAGGDVLYPAHTAVTADELMFLDATAPCGEEYRLAQTAAIMGGTSLAAYLAGIPPLNVTYLVADPALGTNVSIAAYINTGCTQPFFGTANKFPMNKFGVNISMTTHNPDAFMRFTTSPNDWDVGIASRKQPDLSYQCGDLDPFGDKHTGWPGHIVTTFVR